MGGGAHLRMDLPQPEDGQRLREAVRHRRGLHLRGYDADHGEAVSQCLGLSRQSLQRLSGNSQSAPLQGPTSLRNGANEHLFGAWRHRTTRDPTRKGTFQTVSLGTWVNSSILTSNNGP